MPVAPACSRETRARNIESLKSGPLDVLIAGGGVNGAGVIRDLALRNVRSGGKLRIGLVEKGHFASGTSGKNSHLIHGGLRYLKYLDFKLVREALRERAVLLAIAPHLVEPLHFLIPFENGLDKLFYRTGLSVYDWLAGKHGIANHRAVSLKEMARTEPDLKTENFVAGACFLDCRVQSARLVLENIFEAIRHGAAAVNYMEMIQRTRLNGSGWQVRLRDRESGEEFETRANRIVDATGAWSGEDSVRLVRGSHLILPRMNRSEAAVAYFEPSGRIVFFIPWGSSLQCTLVGTTDVDHQDGPDAVRISQEEVQYLLTVARRVFREDAIGEPISAFSSLRPLVRDPSASATKTSREHKIWEDNGVLHIAGGKYTTYRLMSQEVCDLFCREAAPSLEALHLSGEVPVEGNSPLAIRELLDAAPE
ncbi:MAG: glycerol-3-phosphate dehydrogenase/oxidase, partial [Bryobacteraceae bacterium]